MNEFKSLDSALSYTRSQIDSLTQLDPNALPSKELKEMTSAVNQANNYLKSIKEQPIPKYDQKVLQSILKNIEKIKKKSESTEDLSKINPKQKLLNALNQLSNHLASLKNGRGNKTAKTMKVRPVKIKEIKGRVQADKDLNKHLTLVEKELANLKTTFSKSKTVTKDQNKNHVEKHKKKMSSDLKKTDAMLKKTDVILSKGAHHKQALQPNTQSLIEKIQRQIYFLQYKMNIALQIMTGSMQVQAHLFRTTLDEFKARLLALKKLKRGIRVEAIEHDAEKGEEG